ncbi:MAG: radical SAM protein [Candidatus Omnitrophica bacterium]|nr:radical SAM protein [Candidatus Omnitrophota bacterium]
MGIPLQSGIIYGPLESRRFGRSLGINLLPGDRKVCSFDCGYCQYGTADQKPPIVFPAFEDIEREVGAFLSLAKRESRKIDWIMIAGNGEPTLHPDFGRVVRVLGRLRDFHLSGVPIGILSNSSTCHRPEIQEALWKLDKCFMKLDAGTQEVLHGVNKPFAKEGWSRMIGGIYQLRRFALQSMFVTGKADNASPEAVEEWISTVGYLMPESVQVYTLDRPAGEEGILPVPRGRLEEIAKALTEKTGILASVYE